MASTATIAPSAGAEAPAHGGRRRPLLLAVVAVVLLAAGGLGFVLLGGGEADAAGEAAPVEGAVVDVAEMTVNLAGPVTSYARVSFAAVLSQDADEAAARMRFPLLKDAAITELGTFGADMLRTPAGVEQLRTRLSTRAAELYPDGEVLRIVLTELVVQ